ncbi:AQG_2a_G0022500.mRNA.1.CDS.1 [Saccharomyces cerevisiae]|uniref:Yap1802p n=2 Tax=Saccharomyces cerevisiae TaxID=4932 RepID=C8Z9D3_YEAS8|nr:Yap1802p [Saccharomyces cerevisiae YJM993]AJR76330.1 Yap1802p [Saccharomyces cerevisiae YJM189]AJR78331.1 Yap1802p [Saccharomyces cerevisiae YJM248]AJR81275.1 Yap1802p [Saccharomyces cerevisiae YJM450]AJR82266.1 Yap1802p [Saccharomyces cerevisiae YJM453]AJR85260.1 Yap1802p [Saccharomyces cerevisiae YJM627]AJR88199.1 Yap1802p [Saccharomyces cerevisiae YJM969]AJR88699.1 Yap1802p [Saccharomyces cerevisiae YJM972]AJR89188.1 Yap1802p [Saccharomyces cerevisiae YJM975]AJR89672.1 Yap1802p [Sacc
MSSLYTKLVKGATKIKMAPPKQKYVDPILSGTSSARGLQEITHALDIRLSDTAWTIVYKALIVLHLMIQQGEKDVTLRHYSHNLDVFQLRKISHTTKWSSNDMRALQRYDEYLKTRCEEYGRLGMDHLRDNYSSLKLGSKNQLSMDEELDHVESLEIQINALIRNKYSVSDLENHLLLYAFQLLVQDLLGLYNALNEGVITLLESFFELSIEHAKRTLDLYKDFVDMTEYVVRYLKIGKAVGLKIPVIKHITTKLINSLEEHLREETKRQRGEPSEPQQDRKPSTAISSTSSHNNNSNDKNKSIAQKKLEQIREQKRLLEQQLQNQQLLISPTVPQDAYNPFGSQQQDLNNDTFSFEPTQPQMTAQVPQPTANPFLIPQQQQQALQLTSASTMPQPSEIQITPNLNNQQTGMYASNLQYTPNFTGSGFGGYTTTENNAMMTGTLDPTKTGSNNPFSLENIAREQQQQNFQNSPNPFTLQQAQTTPILAHSQTGNPFQAQNVVTSPMGTYMTSPVAGQLQYASTGAQQQPQMMQGQQTGYVMVPTAFVPINQQQQQQQHQQENPNLIDI